MDPGLGCFRALVLGWGWFCSDAWRVAASPSLHTALSNARLRGYGFLVPSDLASVEGLQASTAGY